jgi:hypothetical protein
MGRAGRGEGKALNQGKRGAMATAAKWCVVEVCFGRRKYMKKSLLCLLVYLFAASTICALGPAAFVGLSARAAVTISLTLFLPSLGYDVVRPVRWNLAFHA